MNKGVLQVAGRLIDGTKLTDAAADRIQAVVRAFDPRPGFSAHALTKDSPLIQLVGPGGSLLDKR